METTQPPALAELTKAFEFTNADLEANHSGTMTDKQRVKLRRGGGNSSTARSVMNYGPKIIVCIVIAAVAWAWITFWKLPDNPTTANYNHLFYTFLSVAFVVTVISLIAVYVYSRRRVQKDLTAGVVSAVCGTLSIDPFDARDYPEKFTIHVKSTHGLAASESEFHVNLKQHTAAKNYHKYLAEKYPADHEVCVYYAPVTMTILSVGE